MLTYVEDISNFFDSLVDEGDFSWLTATQRQLALSNAEAQYRRQVTRGDPYYYATSVDLTFSNQREYDLAGGAIKVLGPTPTAPNKRMTRLLSLLKLNTSGEVVAAYENEAHVGVLQVPGPNYDIDFGAGSFVLRGTVLRFRQLQTTPARLWYVPESSVDWTKTAPGDNEWVDDLIQFHEVIALLAYGTYYAIRDGVMPPAIERRMNDLFGDMHQHLMAERQDGGARTRDTFFGARLR